MVSLKWSQRFELSVIFFFNGRTFSRKSFVKLLQKNLHLKEQSSKLLRGTNLTKLHNPQRICLEASTSEDYGLVYSTLNKKLGQMIMQGKQNWYQVTYRNSFGKHSLSVTSKAKSNASKNYFCFPFKLW